MMRFEKIHNPFFFEGLDGRGNNNEETLNEKKPPKL